VGLFFNEVIRSYADCTIERSSCPLLTSRTSEPNAVCEAFVFFA